MRKKYDFSHARKNPYSRRLAVLVLMAGALPGPTASAQTVCPPGSAWPKATGNRRSDVPGPKVEDLVLKAVVKAKSGYSAVLEDCRFNKTYTVSAGTLLVDGRITAIDSLGVSFEVTGEAATPPPKPVLKRLDLKPKKK